MELSFFRDNDDGAVYYKSDDGSIALVESYYGVYRIQNPKFTSYNVISDEKFTVLKASLETFIFALYRSTIISAGGRGGGGSGGIRGMIIEDEGIAFPGTFTTLNFEGASVIVTDDGGGTATVTVGGGSMITGGGTVNRLAMFTPNGSTIGDSPLLRSGNDVIADGFIYFNSGFGIDVVASGGSDVLNIGTTNADVINYGYAGTTHNMNGTVFNVLTTNLNVTDKIITLNDGGAAGSGGNVGFEIEEGGAATGYFIQNTTRDGFDFQASAVTGVATFDLSNLTGNQTATLQDASGTLAYLSDIPAPLNAWLLDGNTTAGEYIGTNNAQPFPIRTNGTLAGTVSSAQLWSIGAAAPVAGVRLLVTGTGNTVATQGFRIDSTTVTSVFAVYDSGQIDAGTANSNLFIGQGSGLLVNEAGGGTENTAVGVSALASITTGSDNVAIGAGSMSGSTISLGNVAVGAGTLDAGANLAYNVAVGDLALTMLASGSQGNVAIGRNTLATLVGGVGIGAFNVAVGFDALALFNDVSGNVSTAVGARALQVLTVGINDAFGFQAMGALSSGDGQNAGFGATVMLALNTGRYNSAFGRYAMAEITTGESNAALGRLAGSGFQGASSFNTIVGTNSAITGVNRTASRNTFLGWGTGLAAHGDANVFLGYAAGTFETGADKLFIDNRTRTNEANARAVALVYGKFAATTAAQVFNVNANLGIGVGDGAFGTSADFVLGIMNGTAPTTSPANMIQIFSVDTDDATASLGLRTEQTVVTEAVVSDRTLKVTINGTIYKICLKV